MNLTLDAHISTDPRILEVYRGAAFSGTSAAAPQLAEQRCETEFDACTRRCRGTE